VAVDRRYPFGWRGAPRWVDLERLGVLGGGYFGDEVRLSHVLASALGLGRGREDARAIILKMHTPP